MQAEVALRLADAEVRGHDDDRVREVGGAAQRVGEPALAQHRQQEVEHLGVGLLDLVEQDDRERLAADRAR